MSTDPMMKVIHYFKSESAPLLFPAARSSNIFFIPEENAVLVMEHAGSTGGNSFFISEKQSDLDEARQIAGGTAPDAVGAAFADVMEFECDSAPLVELINDARLKRKIDIRMEPGIAKLLSKVGMRIKKRKAVVRDVDEANKKIYNKMNEIGFAPGNGMIIIMDMLSGDLFFGSSLVDVIRDAENKHPLEHPHRILHGIQIGYEGSFILEFANEE
jgi:hypothetical protein